MVVNSEARGGEQRLSLKGRSEMEATTQMRGEAGEEAGVSGLVAVPFPVREAQQRVQET